MPEDYKIAAAYIRVSTEDQTDLSPDSQLAKIRDYAKNKGYIVPDEYVFSDDGISGRKANNRPEFNRMIGTAKIKPKPFDAILLWKFSRFARNREDSIVYKSMLRKQCGIDVISISEDVGDDKMSILIEALIEAMDEYYSVNLAEEVRRGMDEKFARGGVINSPPFGYTITPGDKTFSIDTERAPIVVEIYTKYVNGATALGIARELNARGERTNRGGLFDNRAINYILNNPAYIGKIRRTNGKKNDYHLLNQDCKLTDAHHLPIIDKSLWDAAQIRLQNNAVRYGSHKQDSALAQYAYKGLVKCSNCGSTLVATTKSLEGLQCHKYSKGICRVSHYIRVSALAQFVTEQIKQDIKTELVNIKPRFLNTPPKKDNIAAQIQNEEKKLMRAKEAYQAGVDTLEEYKEVKKKITDKISQLKSLEVNKPVDINDAKKKFILRLKKTLKTINDPNISESAKNQMLSSVVEKIVYNSTEKSLQLYYLL